MDTSLPMNISLRDLSGELRKGKVQLETALHVLSQEQCEKPGALPSGSVLDTLSQIVSTDFLALRHLSQLNPRFDTWIQPRGGRTLNQARVPGSP
jgi:hypothetical protein